MGDGNFIIDGSHFLDDSHYTDEYQPCDQEMLQIWHSAVQKSSVLLVNGGVLRNIMLPLMT